MTMDTKIASHFDLIFSYLPAKRADVPQISLSRILVDEKKYARAMGRTAGGLSVLTNKFDIFPAAQPVRNGIRGCF